MGGTEIRFELSGAHLGLAPIPATRLAKPRGWGKALVVEKVVRMLESHHETDSAVEPISDEAAEVAVPIYPGRENGATPEHDDKEDDLKNVLNESRSSEPTLRQIIDKIPTIAWCNLPDGSSEFLNQRWHYYTGLSPQEANRGGWKIAIHPEDLPRLTAKWGTLTDLEPGEYEVRLRRSDGLFRWFLFRIEPLRGEVREVVRWYGAATDIEGRKRIESLRAAEKRTLEMIADGASLRDILNELCCAIDVEASPVISTVLLMDPDGERLWHTAGPLVPRDWLPAISPVLVSPHSACCGAAAFFKKRVIVADVATHINWPDEFKDLAMKNGIRAAWSEPILTKDGEVLGTFALYSSESRIPTDAEIELIEGARHIALIAIERQRSQAALALALEKIKTNEESLHLIVDSIPGQIAVMTSGGEVELVNRQILEYFGKTTEELQNWATNNSFHPDDILRTIDAWKRALETGQPFEFENRGRRADGVYRWFHVRARPLHDAEGRIVRWYVLATDIDDRKRSEGELGKAFEEIKRLKDRLHDENVALREQIDQVFMFEEIVGSSPALKTVLSSIVN